MKFKDLIEFIKADLFRYEKQIGFTNFIKVLIKSPGFKYTFYLRTTNYYKDKNGISRVLFFLALLFLRKYRYKFGIDIPYSTKIGKGLYIGHFGGIVVNSDVIIGENCNLSHGVTIGQVNRGKKRGSPTIGNEVYIAPGAKIIGKINIGDNVVIGTNSVINLDVPNKSVIVGIPGKIVSSKGSAGYVENIYLN
ncbi:MULTISPECIES: serine O-acetyltransferase [unclassified Exiguobacterium]|uniref:serine O-acetyltransferase n=1 Tax=unclassified Exiguobacterium TaxID=2644629 RepID=UPI001EEFF730|nr:MULTISPECIES: serine acetyltransferase [unclassified Exiguobacterium]